jgi:hypothetical protein
MVRISVFARLGYLPLLHILVEERAGERRLTTFLAACHGFPSPFPSPPVRMGVKLRFDLKFSRLPRF